MFPYLYAGSLIILLTWVCWAWWKIENYHGSSYLLPRYSFSLFIPFSGVLGAVLILSIFVDTTGSEAGLEEAMKQAFTILLLWPIIVTAYTMGIRLLEDEKRRELEKMKM